MAERLRWTGIRYRDPDSGRFVSRVAIRRTFEESLGNVERLTDTLASDLRAGRISLLQWREEMRGVIKQVTLAAHQLAVGGRAQMGDADNGRVGQAVRRQYAYLEAWVEQIKAGLPVDGRMEPRAAMYLRSAVTTFLEADRRQMQEQGFDVVHSVLHAGESCAQCIAERDKGYVPVAEIVLPGQRTCLANCNCTLVYARSRTGEVLAA
jgi:hypothetical protein